MRPRPLIQRGVVLFLRFGQRDVSDGIQKTPAVEPVDPFECCELNSFEVSSRSTPMHDLGLVKPVDRFGESIVVADTDTSDRGFDPCFCLPLITPD